MSWWHQAVLGAEDVLQQGLSGVRRLGARSRSTRSPELSHFRGLCCHCAPDWPVHLVHSEGLREAADFVIDFGANVIQPQRLPWPVERLAPYVRQLPRGAIVHLKADWIESFARHLLPALEEPVVIVSGDSDAGFGAGHEGLLDHPKIAHWFAQNCETDTRHPKLTRIPIGIDNPVYTKLEKRLGFALTVALGKTPLDLGFRKNDMGDQGTLAQVACGLPRTAERAARALATFHQNQKLISPDLTDFPERAQAVSALAQSPACHFIARRFRQADCWHLHGEFAFQLSPRGRGLDCFRTWESLFLGTIPIVRRSSLDLLYATEALPVISVDSWADVTPARLAQWKSAYAERFTPAAREKLTLSYWIGKIQRAAEGARLSRTPEIHAQGL